MRCLLRRLRSDHRRFVTGWLSDSSMKRSPSTCMCRFSLLSLCASSLAFALACRSDPIEPDERDEGHVPLVGIGDGNESVVVVGSSDWDGGDGDGDGDGDARPAEPLEVCEVQDLASVARPGGPALLDDFEDGDPAVSGNGLAGWWFGFDDESGGSQLPEPFASEAPGRSSGFGLHITGSGYTEWGSVYAVTLATRGAGGDCLYDASIYDGISFWVKGSIEVDPGNASYVDERDRGVLKVQLHEKRTAPLSYGGSCDPLIGECWNSYRMRIPVTECWTRHAVRFEDLEQDEWGQKFGSLDSSQLYQFALEVTRYHTYDYWIDDIEFFAGETPLSEQECEEPMGGAGASGMEAR